MYPNRRGLERLASPFGIALALLVAPVASAHDADVIYVLLTEHPGGALEEVVTLTAGTLSQLAPIDADKDGALSQADLDARADAIAAGVWNQIPLEADSSCTRSGEQALLREGYVELSARFACPPGKLSQDFRILRVLTSNYRVVLGKQVDGETGRAFAQGNVQRLELRPVPAGQARIALSFGAGVLAPLIWFDVTLVWLLALLLAASVRAVGERWLVLVTVHAVVSLTLGALDLRLPEIVGAGIVVIAGAGYVLQVLARDNERWPLIALGALAVGESLRESVGGNVTFQAGRAVGLALLALVLVPIIRMIARRPALKRKATVVLGCLSLAALGFSLVQTVRTF